MKIKTIISNLLLTMIAIPGIAINSDHIKESKTDVDSSNVRYEFSCILSWGGESKLALVLPKIGLIRKHEFDAFNTYYGIELGIHGGFVAGYGSLSALAGVEKNIFNLETSISHFRTTKIKINENEINGPFSQNLINLKTGVRIKKVRLKIGTSILLNENIPSGQERIPLMDIGKLNNRIWSAEIQIIF